LSDKTRINRKGKKETCDVQELPEFMWLRIGVYEDGLDGVFCAYRKSVGDEVPSMYSYIVTVKVILEQDMKSQSGSRRIALLFL
jgi:hypothetical protein